MAFPTPSASAPRASAEAQALGATRTAEAARRLLAENVAPVVRQVQESGVSNLRGIAAVLNARGMRTARGGRWAATVLRRAALEQFEVARNHGF